MTLGYESQAGGDTFDALTRDTRWGDAFFTFIWLVFLAYPISDLVLGDFHGIGLALASAALAVFVGLYVVVVWWDGFIQPRLPERWRLALLGCLAALTVALALAYGAQWAGLFIYLSVAGAMTLPLCRVLVWVGAVTATHLGVGLVVSMPPFLLVLLAFLSGVVGLGVVGIRRMAMLITELREARQELARLAVNEERTRFARDLHDLLGHSLSLVVLKSELAGRLVETDAARAGREIADIETVARRSLGEVRQAVAGYREQGLSAELDSARSALTAAGVQVTIRGDDATLPAATESLLGWGVREGTTNVLRHSGADHCAVDLRRGSGAVTLEIRDDGAGPLGQRDNSPARGEADGSGHGLRGLAERVEGAGGSVESGPRPEGGYRLAVHIPVDRGEGTGAAGSGDADGRSPEPPVASAAPTARVRAEGSA